MKTPTLDKDVPIPAPRVGPRSELGSHLAAMEIGNSFQTRMQRNTIYSLARYYHISVAVRKEKNGFRVWRVS